MAAPLIPALDPIAGKLRRKQLELAALEARLAECELELLTFRTALLEFQLRYEKAVGPLYAELDRIEAEIAELRAARNPGDRRAAGRARAARAKADQSGRAADESHQQKNCGKFRPGEELKKLYRELAKRFHPDLAGGERERIRFEKLMSAANAAYAEEDEGRLRQLLEEAGGAAEAVDGPAPDGVAAALARVEQKIARLTERLEAIAIEMAELRGSPLNQLKRQVEEAGSRGLDLIQEMAGFLRREIGRALIRKSKVAAGNGEQGSGPSPGCGYG
ncbi:hypothetical protein EDC14_102562 [Hydrogenispora ethanolica]|uniref:J domain-containing protein n=1 Tax=Hydrogenispora ethanolica TaxID=1082276 RepID=A0A4R1R9P3_HYDET|nr:J domain-containing protein [Hydrogenispora ethanolica]TCL62443.1 hypothetical protein EDC14_102562 [Hydrogenispora ethanolica]